jgi:adenosylcobinamide-GDP ribazoletransferase
VLGAVAFLTPFGGARRPGPRTLDWFPVVGAVLGLALGGWWWLAARAWPGGVAAALVVLFDLVMTGMIHLDGLIDSADGLLASTDRRRRLAAMAAPEAGAFGVLAAGAVLLLRWASLASMRPGVLLLGGLWCLSRTFMAVVARTQRYARAEGGIASAFTGETRWLPLLAGLILAAGLAFAWKPVAGVVSTAAAAAVGASVVALARRRIGGYTGDVLGAAGVLAETAGLVVAAAKW